MGKSKVNRQNPLTPILATVVLVALFSVTIVLLSLPGLDTSPTGFAVSDVDGLEEWPSLTPPIQENQTGEQPSIPAEQAPAEEAPPLQGQGFETQDISGCATISSSGTHLLTANISDAVGISDGACVNITANDVVFDCQGFYVDGDDSGANEHGINATGRTNITIKNCIVTDWTRGILYEDTNSSVIQNVSAISNPESAIRIIDSFNVTLASSTASANIGFGLNIAGGGNNNISYNSISGNTGVGVRVNTNNSLFAHNNVSSNTGGSGKGFNIEFGAVNNSIINNTASSNTQYGFFLDGSDNNTFTNNTANLNGDYGFYISAAAENNTFVGNNASYNSGSGNFGFFLDSSHGNNLTGNTAVNNSEGIRLISSNGNTLGFNSIINNTNGIRLASSSANNLVRGNTITNSTFDGVFVSSSNNNVVDLNSVTANSIGVDVSGNSNNITSNNLSSNSFAGIEIDTSDNFVFNNTANFNSQYGIYFAGASANNITNNTAESNTDWDFFAESGGGADNIVRNLEIGSTVISFESLDVAIKNASSPGGEPLTSIGKYVNATNNSVDSWLALNVSYTQSDVAGLIENALNMSKNNASGWFTNPASFAAAGSFGVDAANNIVFANITNFGSIFAPLATTGISSCVNITASGSYNLTGNLTDSFVREGSGICLNIETDDVVIDCNGFFINTTVTQLSAPGVGIDLNHTSSLDNITIIDCGGFINTNRAAIYLVNATNVNITGNNIIRTTTGAQDAGGIVAGGSAGTVVNLTIAHNTLANEEADVRRDVRLLGANATNILIEKNLFADINVEGGVAVYANTQAHNLVIRHNLFNYTPAGSTDTAVHIGSSTSTNHTIVNNTIDFAQGNAIEIINSSITNITNNTIRHTGGGGNVIHIEGANFTHIENNFAFNTSGDFVSITAPTPDTSSFNTTITRNNATSSDDAVFVSVTSDERDIDNISITSNNFTNQDNGILFSDTSGNIAFTDVVIVGNNITNTTSAGINIEVGDGLNISNNIINTTGTGIFLTDDTNSLAYRNRIINYSVVGITLSTSTSTNVSTNNLSTPEAGDGITASSSSDLIVEDNSVSDGASGITFTTTSNSNISRNNVSGATGGGIVLQSFSNDNIVENNSAEFNELVGTNIDASGGNNFTGNNFSSNADIGIDISGSSDSNRFTNNIAENNTVWDYSVESGAGNIVTNLEIGSTIISVEGLDTSLKNSSSPAADPTGFVNIGKFVNATNDTDTAWLFLNVSYTAEDIAGKTAEVTLTMTKYNESLGDWVTDPNDFTDGTFGVDTTNNVVFANITDFASVFAPLGIPAAAPPPAAGAPGRASTNICANLTEFGVVEIGDTRFAGMCVASIVTWTRDFGDQVLILSDVLPGSARATFEINSEEFTLGIGGSQEIDTNSNGVNDLRVSVTNITFPNMAEVFFTFLTDAPPAPPSIVIPPLPEIEIAPFPTILILLIILTAATIIGIGYWWRTRGPRGRRFAPPEPPTVRLGPEAQKLQQRVTDVEREVQQIIEDLERPPRI